MPLHITIPAGELYDEQANEFYSIKEQHLVLEHSLVSISKWESKWHKPFLSKEQKTVEETLDYIRCMTLTQNVDPKSYLNLDSKAISEINEYIENPMTATTFSDIHNRGFSSETVTNELVYYWMIALNIPMECQKWHLNRLLTLIRVCSIKNTPPKKLNRSDYLHRRASLNAARRKAFNTRG